MWQIITIEVNRRSVLTSYFYVYAVVSLQFPKGITLIRNQQATTIHDPGSVEFSDYSAEKRRSAECSPRSSCTRGSVCVSVRSSGINLIYNHSPEIYPTVYKHRAINENEKRKAYLEAGLRSSSANVRESVTFYPAVVGSRAVQEEELESASPETCVSTFVHVCVRAQYVN